jgi:sec-independent protein translocase protein TatA
VGIPSGWELVLVLLVVMVLFGAKRLPDSARSLGRSMRILKAETKGMRDDSDTEVGAHRDTTVTAEPLPPAQPTQPPATGPAGTGDQGPTASGDQAQHQRP